jgi:hypothetical protein
MNPSRTIMGASAFALLFAASFVAAQSPQTVRVRGTIESVNGPVIGVKSRDGAALKVKLADNGTVTAIIPATLADVKPGGFVGITAMPQPDGTQKAVEIHIFPEAMRGTGEGHRPWDLMPNSTMTNGAIDSEVEVSDGHKLVLKYKDGEKTFIVPPNAAIVTYSPGSTADLKPGEKLFVAAATKEADGTLATQRINVGRNGTNPPM